MQSPGIYTQTLHYVLWDGGFKFRRPTVKQPSQKPPTPLPPHPHTHTQLQERAQQFRKEWPIHKPVTVSEFWLKPRLSRQHIEAEIAPSIIYAHPSCFTRGVCLKKVLGYFHLLVTCSRQRIHHFLAAKNTYACINLWHNSHSVIFVYNSRLTVSNTGFYASKYWQATSNALKQKYKKQRAVNTSQIRRDT